VTGAVYAKKLNNEQKRLQRCGVVMQEVLNMPDNILSDLLEKAECVIVIPSVMKLAFGVGASYGRVGRWQRRFSDRRTSDRLDPVGHERPRHGIDSQQ
jgi:lipid-binding SYLF domain-containing protein